MGVIKKVSSTGLIIDYILDRIQRGELKPGDQLMNERAFSEELGVSRMPLREAISALSMMGILDAQQGSGTYIKSYDPNALGRIMSIYSVLDDISIDDLFEVRAIMESQAVRLSVERATEEDIARMEESVREGYAYLERVQKDGESAEMPAEKFTRLNSFHNAVTAGSHNRYLLQFMDSIRAMSSEYVSRSRRDPLSEFSTALEQHKAILEAVRARDADTASRLLYEHLMHEADSLKRSM